MAQRPNVGGLLCSQQSFQGCHCRYLVAAALESER